MTSYKDFFHLIKPGGSCSCKNHNDDIITKSGEIIDRWHTYGPARSDKNSMEDTLENIVKNKLNKVDLPITIGDTGYINLTKHITTYENGWCLDEAGRLVFIYQNILYFRRYENGGPFMTGPLEKKVFNDMTSKETINKIITDLSVH